MSEQLRGAEIFVRALIDEGVEFLFGYPGGAVLHIYDELYKQDTIKHILVRHEQGATHAADGYARATGKPGVVLVTSGPGATNAVTGIATAYMDSIPLVVFTGQVPTHLIGNDAFQEVDSIGITRPCVKHNFLVERVEDLAATIKKAFYVATSGRPGPVVIDVPKDVTANVCAYEYPKTVEIRSYKPNTKGHPGQIKKAAQLIMAAERPMIYTGGGVILDNASSELTQFARLLGFPVTNTLMGLGAYPGSDPQFIGMLGMHGTYESNMAMHQCDVLIAIGARFDDRVTGDLAKFCPTARIIHIDIDPASISKNVRVEVPIVGSVTNVLSELNRLLQEAGVTPVDRESNPWWRQIREWQKLDCLRYDKGSKLIKPQAVIEAASGDRRRRLRHLRRGPAPDVGRAVLQVRPAPALDQLRWPRHHGLRPALRNGRAVGVPRQAGGLRDRRSEFRDVRAGAFDLPAVRPADQGREPQQPLHGHGAAVAGVLLRPPLLAFLHGRAAGLREAG